jgi:hypothetical protein
LDSVSDHPWMQTELDLISEGGPPSISDQPQVLSTLPAPDPVPEVDWSKHIFTNSHNPKHVKKDRPSSFQLPDAPSRQNSTHHQPLVSQARGNRWDSPDIMHQARFHGAFMDLQIRFGDELAMDLIKGHQFARLFCTILHDLNAKDPDSVECFVSRIENWYTAVLACRIRVMCKRPSRLGMSQAKRLNEKPIGRVKSAETVRNYFFQMIHVGGKRFTNDAASLVYNVLKKLYPLPAAPTASMFLRHMFSKPITGALTKTLPPTRRRRAQKPNLLARFATLPPEMQLAIWHGFFDELWHDLNTAPTPLPLVFNVVYRDGDDDNDDNPLALYTPPHRKTTTTTIGGAHWHRAFDLVPSLHHDAPCGRAGVGFFQRIYALATTCRDARDVLLTRALGISLAEARADGGRPASRALYQFGWVPRARSRIVLSTGLRELPRPAFQRPALWAVRRYGTAGRLEMHAPWQFAAAAAGVPARTAGWMQRHAEARAQEEAAKLAAGMPLWMHHYREMQLAENYADLEVDDAVNNNFLYHYQKALRQQACLVDPLDILNPTIPSVQFDALRGRSHVSFISPPYIMRMSPNFEDPDDEEERPVLDFWDTQFPRAWMHDMAPQIHECAGILMGKHWRQVSRLQWQPSTYINGREMNLVEVEFDDEI